MQYLNKFIVKIKKNTTSKQWNLPVDGFCFACLSCEMKMGLKMEIFQTIIMLSSLLIVKNDWLLYTLEVEVKFCLVHFF